MYFSSTFQDELKIAVIISVYKKQDVNDKTNYRPVKFLTNTAPALIIDYLTNRLQRVKIRSAFNFEIPRGIPQGSILGAISFNLFVNDLMFSLRKQKFAILPMILWYTHVH